MGSVWGRRGLAVSTAVMLCAGLPAQAQFGDLLRSVRDAAQAVKGAGDLSRDVGELIRNVKSITTVSTESASPDAASSPENADGKVVIYTSPSCGYCKLALKHLNERQIPHVDKDIKANSTYAAAYLKLGGRGVPHILMGGTVMRGFSAESFDRQYAAWKGQGGAVPTAATPAQLATAAATSATAPAVARTASAEGALAQSGDTLMAKIKGVKVMAQPGTQGGVVLTLGKDEEVVYLGEQREGFVKVSTAQGEGWVNRNLLRKL